MLMFQLNRHLKCILALQYIFLATSFTPQTYPNSMQKKKQLSPSVVSMGAYSSPRSSPLEDEPWKEDESYWDMLQEASKDPATFEKFIEESTRRKKLGKPLCDMNAAGPPVTDEKPKKKGKYVPIEEWDAKQKEDMSAEEKLQWECQRGGNQLRQNDILMHHLNSL